MELAAAGAGTVGWDPLEAAMAAALWVVVVGPCKTSRPCTCSVDNCQWHYSRTSSSTPHVYSRLDIGSCMPAVAWEARDELHEVDWAHAKLACVLSVAEESPTQWTQGVVTTHCSQKPTPWCP